MIVGYILCGYLLHDYIGHLSLWKLGIYHRDVSLNNLVSKTVNDEEFGMLIDFDLAIRKEDMTVSYNRRVGALPFMAIDLAQEWGFKVRTDHIIALMQNHYPIRRWGIHT
ncbi:hypothetical protein CPB86DRAFT_791052 [Serendipita vermifera]|nr:hypothetical protein CPB86DRAFT_791052 [Serendipita vermifera]